MTSTVKRCGCGGRFGYSLRREADVCHNCGAYSTRPPTMEDLKYLDRSITELREHRLELWRDMSYTDVDINEQVTWRKKLVRKVRRATERSQGS